MVNLIPDENKLKQLLSETGAVRHGHFEFPSGLHTDTFFQMPLALRYYDNVRRLGVALSRLLRRTPHVASELPHITIVAPASGGIPVAFSVREALAAHQVVWAEKKGADLYFRPYAGIEKGAQCIVVDDIMLTSRTLQKLISLVRENGGRVLAAGVLVDAGIQQPAFDVPFLALIRYQTRSYPNASACELCKQGQPLTKVEF